MKPSDLSTAFISLLFLFVFVTVSSDGEGIREGDRWKHIFWDNEGSEWYYDALSATRSGNVITIWMKGIPAKGSQAFLRLQRSLMQAGRSGAATLKDAYNVEQYELECRQKTFKRLSTAIYDSNGNMLIIKSDDPRRLSWQSPESLFERLLFDVCWQIKQK